MKKLKTLTLTGAAITGITLLVVQRGELSRLQRQIFALQQQVENLTREKEALSTQAAQPASIPSDEKQLRELLKLRNEVARLRAQLREQERRDSQVAQTSPGSNAPPTASMSAFGAELHDMGAKTPDRAATSFIWAAVNGDRARISELLELPANVPDEDASKHYDFFTRQFSNVFSHMEFLSVQSVAPNPDGTLRLNQVVRNTDTGKTYPFPFMLRPHDSGWKVVVEGEAPAALPPQ